MPELSDGLSMRALFTLQWADKKPEGEGEGREAKPTFGLLPLYGSSHL